MRITSLLLPALCCTPALAQQTLDVPAAFPTIQSAIVAAQPGDSVRVAPGTYVEQLDYLGKAITVESVAGPTATTIDSAAGEIPASGGEYTEAVVNFASGEGSDSVLRGFTVTGADEGYGLYSAGVFALGATPWIEDCHIVGNRGSRAGAVLGSAVMVDCELRDNRTDFGAGAVLGQPTMIRCLVDNNRSGNEPGGGVNATGPCDLIDCVIVRNETGFDGYSGGGVFGPANLTGCIVAFNIAQPYLSGGPTIGGVTGGGLANVGRVERCTVYGNEVPLFGLIGEGGGISGAAEVVDSIVWANEPDQVRGGPPVSFSTVQGGYPGQGNLAADPLFANAAALDFSLLLGSPCIDAGDPLSDLDADGTRADQGAVPSLGALISETGFELAIATGGGQEWTLEFPNVGPSVEAWLILGSASGTSPATPIDGVLVPLVPDGYTQTTFAQVNTATFENTFTLALNPGPVAAAVNVPAGVLSPALAGLTLHHAALALDIAMLQVTRASNALPLTLVP